MKIENLKFNKIYQLYQYHTNVNEYYGLYRYKGSHSDNVIFENPNTKIPLYISEKQFYDLIRVRLWKPWQQMKTGKAHKKNFARKLLKQYKVLN